MNDSENRVLAVFAEALEIADAGARDAYLARACGENLVLRQEVEELLQAQVDAGRFLPDRPADHGSLAQGDAPLGPGMEQAGDWIGRYKLLEKIGEGGCGIVYLAEQHRPVRRKVALKLIKAGMDTRSVVARFELERQALALMDHPNIAKIFDAGVTTGNANFPIGELGPRAAASSAGWRTGVTGRPYFVMEHVRGNRITDFCDQGNLGIRERLELFIKVCRAVQHAHQKGVIHRDLKPSNVLVAQQDGEPVPKVIDFGVAKALGQRLTEKTLFTRLEQFIGTPAYMSPEQAGLGGLDIDTRSDIYSLGVLLYKLLTGDTPLDSRRLPQGDWDEIRRMIRETDPPKPSTRLTELVAAAAEDERRSAAEGEVQMSEPERDALRRQVQRRKEMIKAVRGDLDWIIMKALDKDRRRRYETVNGLAMDLERYLHDEAVVARPPSALYRLQKVTRRHRVAFAAGAATAAALLLGVVVSTWQAVRATDAEHRARIAQANESRERQRAERNAAKNQQVARLLQETLQRVASSTLRDRPQLKNILDTTARGVREELRDQPEVEAELLSAIGRTYYQLGSYPQAEAMHREALVIYRKIHVNDNLLIVASLNDLANTLSRQRKLIEAEDTLQEAIRIGRTRPDQQALLAISLDSLAGVLLAEFDWGPQSHASRLPEEAQKLAEESSMIRSNLFGSEHLAVAESLETLGWVRKAQGNVAETEAIFRDVLAMRLKLSDPQSQPVANAMLNLALVLIDQNKTAEVDDLHRDALAIFRNLFGDEHPAVAALLGRRGEFLARLGKWSEAIDCLSCAIATEPANDWPYHLLAPLLVHTGDVQAYRKSCREMRSRFNGTRLPVVAEQMAKACLLLPPSPDDLETIRQWSRIAVGQDQQDEGPPWSWGRLTRGLAEFRLNHFEDSVTWLQSALRQGDQFIQVIGLPVLAMAQYHLNQTEQAQATLARAVLLQRKLPSLDSRYLGHGWDDLLVADILGNEAQALLQGKSGAPSDGTK